MRFKIYNLIIFTVLLGVFISCDEDPSNIGSGLLIGDQIETFTFNSQDENMNQKSSTYQEEINLGASARILVGKNDDLIISALLRFGLILPDSLKAAIEADSINFLESWIKLFPNYSIGDDMAELDMGIFNVNEEWQSTDFNLDTLSQLSISQADIKISQNISDSLYIIQLQPSVTGEWLKNLADSTFQKHYGIQLKAANNVNKIIGFQAFSTLPDSPVPTLHYVVEKPGEFTDTLSFGVFADVHVVESEFPVVTTNKIILNGGYASRGKLFMDISQLPKKAGIVSAELSLMIDPSETIQGEPASNSIDIAMLSDSTTNEVLFFSSGVLSRNDSVYSGEISNIIRLWLTGEDNQGIALNLSDETSSAAKISFYGSEAAIGLRPKLIVTYSTQ